MHHWKSRVRKGYPPGKPWPTDDLQPAGGIDPLRVSQLIDAGGAGGLAPKFGQRRWATCSTQGGCKYEDVVSRVRNPRRSSSWCWERARRLTLLATDVPQKSMLPGVRGNGITSRTFAIPVT